MQRVTIQHGPVEDGRTGERYDDGEEPVLTDAQVAYLNRDSGSPRVETIERVDPEADTDADGIDDAEDVTFDAVTFADRDYEDVVADIEAGDADGHLDAVREADTELRDGREHVREALDRRAAELAEE